MKIAKTLLAIAALSLAATGALASGTLYDDAILMITFADGADEDGQTPVSAENDGTYIWTANGGFSSGFSLAKYDQSGNFISNHDNGVDYRSLFASSAGQLYAKLYQGGIYSIDSNGNATYMFDIPFFDAQSSASFNTDESELLTMSGGSIHRFNAANGAMLGSIALSGYGTVGNEASYPYDVQMETESTGRIITFTLNGATGTCSEWDYAGNRIGMCNVALNNASDFGTGFSFGVGNDGLVYFHDPASDSWSSFDIGLSGPTATTDSSWSQVKSLF